MKCYLVTMVSCNSKFQENDKTVKPKLALMFVLHQGDTCLQNDTNMWSFIKIVNIFVFKLQFQKNCSLGFSTVCQTIFLICMCKKYVIDIAVRVRGRFTVLWGFKQ